jgi:uncharacterized repeat protein (TIGR03803 family)
MNGLLYGTVTGARDFSNGSVFSVSTTGVGKTLHQFQGPDGSLPWSILLADSGTLYGETYYGGSGHGVVFSVTTSGAETTLYSFTGGTDGSNPMGGLIAVNGTLYGTTNQGGGSGCSDSSSVGCGTVFSISPSGSESVLYRFTGNPDGANPGSAPLLDVNGTLYGTTMWGGAHGKGTVFTVTTSGSEKVLHSFGSGSDGFIPFAPLINVGGTLYGTTQAGGAHGKGTVFSISKSGSEKVLYSFAGAPDGEEPDGGLIYRNGMFYGTTLIGGASGCIYGTCGTIYSLSPSGSERVLHRFAAGSDGALPNGAFVDLKGTLYSTTVHGGGTGCSNTGCGTVFALTP